MGFGYVPRRESDSDLRLAEFESTGKMMIPGGRVDEPGSIHSRYVISTRIIAAASSLVRTNDNN